MPFAELLDYVTGHTIRGRAENKSFRGKKKKYLLRAQEILLAEGIIHFRYNTFLNVNQSSTFKRSKICLITIFKILAPLQEMGLEQGCFIYFKSLCSL